MPTPRHRTLALLVLALSVATPASGVVVGQTDDFQDGTTQGWIHGVVSPVPPIVVLDAGPAGPGDDALQIESIGGAGPGSRFAAFNQMQWTGDFTAAGVAMLVLDVNNVGATGLDLRVGFDGAGGRFVTTASIPIAAGSGWQTVGVPVLAADLSAAGGLDVDATLGGVTQLRLISAANPTYEGDVMVAQALFDNITAVPEPAESVLLLPGLALVALLARRRQGGRPARAR